MDPLVYLIVLLLVVIFVVLLPLVSGVGSYSVNKPKKGTAKSSTKAGHRSLKEFAKLKKDDAPIKFSISPDQTADIYGSKKFETDGKTGLKKRMISKYSTDEGQFDYDVDELIAEDLLEQQREESARYAKFMGKENETQEHLV